MPSDTSPLKPCPFCGAEAEIIHIEDGENAGGSCVSCTRCQASSNVEFEFKENFVSNWNRRTPDTSPSPEGLREAATALLAQFDAYCATGTSHSDAHNARALSIVGRPPPSHRRASGSEAMTPPDPLTPSRALERCGHGIPMTRDQQCDRCELIWLKSCHEGARERLERREKRIAFLELRITSQECGDA